MDDPSDRMTLLESTFLIVHMVVPNSTVVHLFMTGVHQQTINNLTTTQHLDDKLTGRKDRQCD